jgi:hypothetical protein
MFFISHIKRSGLTLACLVAALQLYGQSQEFRFFPVKGLAMEQQGLIGRTGNHLFLVNLANPASLDLYIHDMLSQEGVNRSYPFNRSGMAVVTKPSSNLFITASPEKEGITAHFLELDERGDILLKKDMAVPALKMPVRILVSADKSRVLLYQQVRKGRDSVLIRGSLFNTAAESLKQLVYSFRHDEELDMDPEVFLDNAGNTHVLVYDKPTNYRISADLSLNTMPLAEEQIVSETFSFSKVKLKTMHVFQNSECNCIQAEGLYVDGMDKNNKGIYSIAFPPGRKNELAPRFIPFPPEMIRNFKHGFSATEETVQRNLQLQEIFYNDSGSFVVLRVGAGEPQRVMNAPGTGSADKNLRQSIAVSRSYDVAPPSTAVTSSAPRVRGTPRPAGTAGVTADRNSDLSPIVSSIYKKPPPLLSRAGGRNAPKIAFIKLDKDQGIAWHASRSLDIFNASADLYNQQFMAGALGQQLGMVLYQPDALDEPLPVFISIQNGKLLQEKLPEKKLVFSPVQQFSPGQFGAVCEQ